MSKLSHEERVLRSRIAAHRLHSLYDSRELTKRAREAFNSRFERQVDPTGELPEEERRRRAEHARKAFFAEIALRSARARRRRTEAKARRDATKAGAMAPAQPKEV